MMKVAKKIQKSRPSTPTMTAKEIRDKSQFRMQISENCDLGLGYFENITEKEIITYTAGSPKRRETRIDIQKECQVVLWIQMKKPIRTFRILSSFRHSQLSGKLEYFHNRDRVKTNPAYKKLKKILLEDSTADKKEEKIKRYFRYIVHSEAYKDQIYYRRDFSFFLFLFLKTPEEVTIDLKECITEEFIELLQVIGHPLLETDAGKALVQLYAKLKV